VTTLRNIFATILIAASTVYAEAELRLGIDGEDATSIGIYIKDLRTNEIIAERNSQVAMTPASTMKTITSASALSKLGENYRFSTTCRLVGDYSDADQTTWHGDLVIYGANDPTLDSSHFKDNKGFCDSIVANLTRMGIKRIDGQIVVEQNLSDCGVVPEWEVDDVAWAYGTGLFGFNYKDNTYTLYPVTEQTSPYVPDLNIYLQSSTEGNNILRGAFSNDIYAFSPSMNDKSWAVNSSMPDPAAVVTAELYDLLAKKGINISGDYNEDSQQAKRVDVYTHKSPTSKEILSSLMKRSDNLFAEGMLRAAFPNMTRSKAIKAEKELWTSRGVSANYTIIRDGSGLARANKLSPRFIGNVLEWMAKSDMAETYTSFFPRAGKEGTMKSFLLSSPKTAAHIAMKTGSVNAVQCYAGYYFDSDNKPTHIIVIMVNGFFCPRAQVREAIEKLLIKTF
jgi:D-alanyl-D-alanine carboxypeptidase/D-alanyl-D-alanine-endopeptidase (penicillin-binding protein 4)